MKLPKFKLNTDQIIGLVVIVVTWSIAITLSRKVNLADITLLQWFCLHLLSSIFLATGFQIYFSSFKWSLAIGNFCLHFFLPLIGGFFAATLIITMSFSKRMELLADFHEEDAALATSGHKKNTDSYDQSVQKTHKVEPLVEVIRSHSGVDLKRGAIETLTNIANPHSISLLKECLSDNNSEVRFYASSGLSRIEERLNGEIIRCKEKVKKHKEPHAQEYFQLAKAYYEFIYLSIQDEASLQYYLKQSIKFFEKAHDLASDDQQIIKSLERAYTRDGQHEKAKSLQQEKDPNEAESPMYQAEALFKEGKFKACLEIIQEIDAETRQWETINDVALLWESSQKRRQEEVQSA